jgi:hypothetical protein
VVFTPHFENHCYMVNYTVNERVGGIVLLYIEPGFHSAVPSLIPGEEINEGL